jgi:undecaprenyl phosphate N,N'-diacetylbacillosamine 1-phosphate transferase
MYVRFFKRLMDLFLATLLLVALCPLFFLLICLLFFFNRKQVFFFQPRIGLQNKLFVIYKFKTMSDAKDAAGNLLPDADRLTKVGFFLRKYSLDEIPQLFNILIGNMSLVGPRPLLPEYLSLYNLTQIRRHEVKPGITGLAQINGRNTSDWQSRFFYDVEYVENISFGLDMKILWLTFKKLLTTSEIHGEIISEKFQP